MKVLVHHQPAAVVDVNVETLESEAQHAQREEADEADRDHDFDQGVAPGAAA